MTRKHSFTYENSIEMLLCGEHMTFDVRIDYDFIPATPASGFYGRPENFDPGCGGEVEITAISLRHFGSEAWFKPEPWLLEAVCDNVGLKCTLEEDGDEKAADEALAALDFRDEMRAEMAREDRYDLAAE